MTKEDILQAIEAKQTEHDRIEKRWNILNHADNPYSSGVERAKHATRLGHLHMTMKELKAEIAELQAQLN